MRILIFWGRILILGLGCVAVCFVLFLLFAFLVSLLLFLKAETIPYRGENSARDTKHDTLYYSSNSFQRQYNQSRYRIMNRDTVRESEYVAFATHLILKFDRNIHAKLVLNSIDDPSVKLPDDKKKEFDLFRKTTFQSRETTDENKVVVSPINKKQPEELAKVEPPVIVLQTPKTSLYPQIEVPKTTTTFSKAELRNMRFKVISAEDHRRLDLEFYAPLEARTVVTKSGKKRIHREIVSPKSSPIELSREDLKTLLPKTWVNDHVSIFHIRSPIIRLVLC